MTVLALATAVFLLTHLIPSTPLRAALVGWIGERTYQGLYSLIALATIRRARDGEPLKTVFPVRTTAPGTFNTAPTTGTVAAPYAAPSPRWPGPAAPEP